MMDETKDMIDEQATEALPRSTPEMIQNELVNMLPYNSRVRIRELTIGDAKKVIAAIDSEFSRWASRQESLITLKKQITSELLGDNR